MTQDPLDRYPIKNPRSILAVSVIGVLTLFHVISYINGTIHLYKEAKETSGRLMAQWQMGLGCAFVIVEIPLFLLSVGLLWWFLNRVNCPKWVKVVSIIFVLLQAIPIVHALLLLSGLLSLW